MIQARRWSRGVEIKTVGIDIIILKTVTVGIFFVFIKLKKSNTTIIKLIENNIFYIFLITGTVGNDIIYLISSYISVACT